MGRPNLLIQFTILAFIIWPSSSSSSSSIYDVLRSHGLPPGLLPKGITNFTIDPATGRFESHLDSSCNAKFETDFHYEATVAGTLAIGQIGDVSGVSAQDLFLWFPVKGVRVDVPSSGVVYFDVGDGVRKQFSFSSFETPQDCAASPAPANLVLFHRDGPIVELNKTVRLEFGDTVRLCQPSKSRRIVLLARSQLIYGQIVQNQLGKLENDLDRGDALRAAY